MIDYMIKEATTNGEPEPFEDGLSVSKNLFWKVFEWQMQIDNKSFHGRFEEEKDNVADELMMGTPIKIGDFIFIVL